ncbi:MAG: hypothetical protein ACYTAS_06085 [Planctomycetota bacterium]|jgi:Tfp pilus assembly protein PilO
MEQSTNMRWVSWVIDATGVGICVAASIAVYALGLVPLLEQRASVAAQRQQVSAQRASCAEAEASVKHLENQLAAAQEELAAGQIQLQPASGTNERVAALAALLGDHGLEIDDVQIGAALPSSRCTVVPISIAGRGEYEKSVSLLHELIRTFADTSLAKLELVGNPASSDRPPKFRLDMLWYTSPESPASLSWGGGTPGLGAYRL